MILNEPSHLRLVNLHAQKHTINSCRYCVYARALIHALNLMASSGRFANHCPFSGTYFTRGAASNAIPLLQNKIRCCEFNNVGVRRLQNKQSNKQSNKFGNWKNAQYGLKYLSHLGLNKQSNKQSLGYQRPSCSATPSPTPQQTEILSPDIRRNTRVLSQPQLFGEPLKRRGNVLSTEH